MAKHKKHRRHKVGAVTQKGMMSGAALVGGAAAGYVASSKLVPMMLTAATLASSTMIPWAVNLGRAAIGVVGVAASPDSVEGDLMKGAAIGVGVDGLVNIADYFLNGGTMGVAGPMRNVSALGRRHRMRGPVNVTNGLGRANGYGSGANMGLGYVAKGPVQNMGAAVNIPINN